jgi:hypothetical protein
MALVLIVASQANAQIRRHTVVTNQPTWWGSLSLGLYGANGISDGQTASTWDFGNGTDWQYRASLEKTLPNQFAIGGVATYVKVPLIYSGPSCGRCGAHLDLTSIGASFHAGEGPGLNQILEASAGAAMYRNFRRDSDGTTLPPAGGNIDPFFTFGYGFGYTFNPTMQVSIVQDYGLVLHERTGLTNDQSNTLTQRSTRLNFRMGFGNRPPRK